MAQKQLQLQLLASGIAQLQLATLLDPLQLQLHRCVMLYSYSTILFQLLFVVGVGCLLSKDFCLGSPSGILERGRKWTSKFARRPTRDCLNWV